MSAAKFVDLSLVFRQSPGRSCILLEIAGWPLRVYAQKKENFRNSFLCAKHLPKSEAWGCRVLLDCGVAVAVLLGRLWFFQQKLFVLDSVNLEQTARSNPLHRRCRRCQAWRSPIPRAWKPGNLMNLINFSFFWRVFSLQKIMFLCDFVIFQYLSYWILNLILTLAWLHRCRGFAMWSFVDVDLLRM